MGELDGVKPPRVLTEPEGGTDNFPLVLPLDRPASVSDDSFTSVDMPERTPVEVVNAYRGREVVSECPPESSTTSPSCHSSDYY